MVLDSHDSQSSTIMEPLLTPHNTNKESTVSWICRVLISGIRVNFLLAGFVFGSAMEAAYVMSICNGYVKILLPSEDATHASAQTSIRIENFSDVFFYELSYLFADVLFLLYIALLTRSILRQRRRIMPGPNSTFQVAVNSANWTVGMVVGLVVAVSMVVGARLVFHERFWQILGSIALGIALCFIGYQTAREFENVCLGPTNKEYSIQDEEFLEGSYYVAVHIV